jgi:hypothetical protein
LDILKQELFMSDHMHAMIVDQVIITLHLITSDKFHDQVILDHLIVIGKRKVFIATDVIKAWGTMILAPGTRLGR